MQGIYLIQVIVLFYNLCVGNCILSYSFHLALFSATYWLKIIQFMILFIIFQLNTLLFFQTNLNKKQHRILFEPFGICLLLLVSYHPGYCYIYYIVVFHFLLLTCFFSFLTFLSLDNITKTVAEVKP